MAVIRNEHARSTHGLPGDARRPPAVLDVVDTALGVAAQSALAARRVSRPAVAVVRPLVGVALRPPLVPARVQPATWLSAAARRGAALRRTATSEMAVRFDAALPVIASKLDGHVDLTEIVKGHVDLVGVAQDLVTEIDLPEIIRGSSSAIVSESVLGVRLQSISADEALTRATGRLRARLSRRAGTPPQTS